MDRDRWRHDARFGFIQETSLNRLRGTDTGRRGQVCVWAGLTGVCGGGVSLPAASVSVCRTKAENKMRHFVMIQSCRSAGGGGHVGHAVLAVAIETSHPSRQPCCHGDVMFIESCQDHSWT